MKLRQKPDDFIVEELPNKEWKQSGSYAVYKVSKVGMTTFAAEKVLATHCGVKFNKIGFAGLKDTHARTVQYFSVDVQNPQVGVFQEKNVRSELVGFLDEQLRTGDLKGNRFVITVRNLSEKDVEVAKKNEQDVRAGVPNYFDSQRFGSLKGVEGFIAKDVLKGDFESAVKKIVTATTRHQKAKIRGVRKFILAHWGDWRACLELIEKNGLERTSEGTIMRYLAEKPQDFKGAFQRVFKGIRELFFSAYQSFVWNECVKKVVRETSSGVFSVPYEAGKLVFGRKWRTGELKTLPLLAADMRVPKEYDRIIKQILAQERMALVDFFTDEHMYVARERELVLVPNDFAVTFADDELHVGKKKACVSFWLGKGSYATIITKALFEQ